eukprot:1116122-Pyramimonas_sp.AAC.1
MCAATCAGAPGTICARPERGAPGTAGPCGTHGARGGRGASGTPCLARLGPKCAWRTWRTKPQHRAHGVCVGFQ